MIRCLGNMIGKKYKTKKELFEAMKEEIGTPVEIWTNGDCIYNVETIYTKRFQQIEIDEVDGLWFIDQVFGI